jgi:hypothetical protein
MNKRIITAILVLCSTPARAGDIGRALVEISIRASLQVTSEATFETTTHETSPDHYPCHMGHRYSTCMRIDPEVGDQLVREAFAGKGTVLHDFADGLDVDEGAMAAAIVTSMPPAPTRTDLQRVLLISGPALLKS